MPEVESAAEKMSSLLSFQETTWREHCGGVLDLGVGKYSSGACWHILMEGLVRDGQAVLVKATVVLSPQAACASCTHYYETRAGRG